jgi:hypothetical protein
MPSAPPATARAGTALLAASTAALGLAVVAATSGGFVLSLAGQRLSMRSPTNPLLAAALLAAAGVRLAGLARTTAMFGGVARWADARAPWVATALAAGVFIGTAAAFVPVAGAADAAGYMSQARLWRRGSLSVPVPLSGELQLAYGAQALTPLGFGPAPEPGSIVPSYPPGLPLLLAAAGTVGLDRVLVPAAAAGLVWLTFVLGRVFGGPLAGLAAAAAAAGSPTVWYQAVQPMSDVPAACAWTLGVVWLVRRERRLAFAAGVSVVAAALVRPNLFAVAPLLAAGAWWWGPAGRERWWQAALFSLPVVPAALAFAVYQRVMHGAATDTGHGGLSVFFALGHVWPNLLRYPAWLVSTSPLLLAAAAAPWALGATTTAPATPGADDGATWRVRAAWTGLVSFAAMLAFYLLYLVFEDWTYTRFLLPAQPWMFALAGVTVTWAFRRLPDDAHRIAVVAVAMVAATWGLGQVRGVGTFRLQASEQRYVAVADVVRASPANAVVIAMQHSGSLAYYTGRPVLRWDWIEPAELDRTLDALRRRGRPVYAVLEDWELPQVRARFGAAGFVERLPPPVFTAGLPRGIQVGVYRLSD